LASTRGEGVTIIGAITSMSNKLIYYLCDGSSIENIKIFFLGLNNAIQLKDKVIVLDNLQAHKNLIFRKWLENSVGAKLMFLPVATSFFNPIETIWAWIKA
jgi:transposase